MRYALIGVGPALHQRRLVIFKSTLKPLDVDRSISLLFTALRKTSEVVKNCSQKILLPGRHLAQREI